MQRYTVNICDDTGGRSCILVPFQPFALVDAFKDEIVKRAARQNPPITITAENHMLILRLQSLSGPILDVEDVLADVVLTSETIFAVFSQRSGHVTALPSHVSQDTSTVISAAVSEEPAAEPIEGESIRVRVVTPATAKQVRSSMETFAISVDATIQQLHEQVARHLRLPASFDKGDSRDECNCSFARKLSDHHSSPATTFVIYDKSAVDSISVTSQSTAEDLSNAL
jgi:hypothetical protein